MNEKQINQAIKNSINDITPDVFKKVANAHVMPQKTEDYIMRENQSVKKNTVMKFTLGFTTVAATIALFVGGGFYWSKNAVATTIAFDVNPSIELTANKYDEVLDVNALNEDGTVILENMDLSNANIEDAVSEIMGSMVDNGYINEEKNTVLMSVDNEDQQKVTEIAETVKNDIDKVLTENNIEGTVLNQSANSDKATAKLAEEHNISVNKMAFIKNIIRKNPELTIEELASLNMQQIKDLMKEKKVNLHEIVDYDNDDDNTEVNGQVSSKENVNKDKENAQVSSKSKGNVQVSSEDDQSDNSKANDKVSSKSDENKGKGNGQVSSKNVDNNDKGIGNNEVSSKDADNNDKNKIDEASSETMKNKEKEQELNQNKNNNGLNNSTNGNGNKNK